MSDPALRDRIAAALKLKYLGSDDLHAQAADAVIAELGLHREELTDGLAQIVLKTGGERGAHRYAIEWAANE